MAEPGSVKFSDRHGLRVQVDHDLCAGFADCVEAAPEAFQLNDDGLAVVVEPDGVEADSLRQAAEVCPVSAILLFDREGAQIAPEL